MLTSPTVALLKNEYGDLAIDSLLASSKSISGVTELLNGCICCNLVGQLSEALATLKSQYSPDRIFIETSGSAFPATLAIEVNRIAKESHNEDFVLDGVITIIDVENWKGYEDTSYTAKLQARYTDLIVFNKWETVNERRFDDCLDRVGDLEIQVAWVKSQKGRVDKEIILGLDGALLSKAKDPLDLHSHAHENNHDHKHDHQSEAEVLGITLEGQGTVDLDSLELLLLSAPKDEVYRIKGLLRLKKPPTSSSGEKASVGGYDHRRTSLVGIETTYVLNWAFGRWSFTPLAPREAGEMDEEVTREMPVRITMIIAQGEGERWKKKVETGGQIELAEEGSNGVLTVKRIA